MTGEKGGTPAVEILELWKTFEVGDGQLHALRGVSLNVAAGEVVGVVGESGSGKSTLLHIAGALDSPSRGKVIIGGFDPFTGRDRAVSDFRNTRVGFVFQHNNLLAEFNALENVMMPALIAGQSESRARERARFLLGRVGMEPRLRHYPGQLSGGEQQRVAIARALINEPVLVLADEPSGNLDSENAARIHNLFLQINADLGTTMVVVTHNAAFAGVLPRVVELRDGAVVRDVCKTPRNRE